MQQDKKTIRMFTYLISLILLLHWQPVFSCLYLSATSLLELSLKIMQKNLKFAFFLKKTKTRKMENQKTETQIERQKGREERSKCRGERETRERRKEREEWGERKREVWSTYLISTLYVGAKQHAGHLRVCCYCCNECHCCCCCARYYLYLQVVQVVRSVVRAAVSATALMMMLLGVYVQVCERYEE